MTRPSVKRLRKRKEVQLKWDEEMSQKYIRRKKVEEARKKLSAQPKPDLSEVPLQIESAYIKLLERPKPPATSMPPEVKMYAYNPNLGAGPEMYAYNPGPDGCVCPACVARRAKKNEEENRILRYY